MSDDLRNRFKHVLRDDKDSSSEDIFSIWDEQKKMRAEDQRIAKEIQETKKRAKELKKTLRNHQIGETKISLIKKYKKINISRLVQIKEYLKGHSLFSNKRKKLVAAGILTLLVVIGIGAVIFNNSDDQKATLGDSSTKITIPEDLPRETPSDFSLLVPSGLSQADLDIVRISPDGAEPSYTYLDRITPEGTIFRVTQQKIPENFNLAEVATDFQATDIIQVDDIKIFHGYSEKGRVQSLIFTKKDVLFTIRSSEKFPDDTWVAYVASLN